MEATPEPDAPRASKDVWMRGLIMLAFVVAFAIREAVLVFIAIVQFFWLLLGRGSNRRLARFGRSFGDWLAQVARYQACATDVKPFPWAPWPDGPSAPDR